MKIRDRRTQRRFFVDNVIMQGWGLVIGVYGILEAMVKVLEIGREK